jgi:hypothetical protein
VIGHNVYFNGAVQSLGFTSERGRATIGVIAPGEFAFGTAVAEHMVITTGALNIQLPGEGWRAVRQGDTFDVAAQQSFKVRAEAPVSYVCYYKD